MADSGSDQTVAGLHGWALLALAVAVAVGLAGAFVLGRSVAPGRTNAAADPRAARFAALLQLLDLDADQRARADALFAEARRRTDTIRNADARRIAYRALMRQAMTTLRATLNADQRAVLDRVRAREAAAETSSERADKARLDQFVALLDLDAGQRAIAAPLLVQATRAADAASVDKAGVLEAGYRCTFFTLGSTLNANQKAKLNTVSQAGAAMGSR